MIVPQTGPLLMAFYGDDFTGSTDALEFLSRAGLRAALFLDVPASAQLAAMPGLQAVGVAGLTRSLPPPEMETCLRAAFAGLRELAPRHVHYKVCSTFDSSPTVGSIGRAIDVGAELFGGRYVPLLVAAPALGRYCVFGNLFARLGIGSAGGIHRLDRHPVMSRHPVTPADEADLRLHLARQTRRKIGLVDILRLQDAGTRPAEALEREIAEGAEVVLFDALHESDLRTIGAIIDAEARAGGPPVFSVGSSGIGAALGARWRSENGIVPRADWPKPAAVESLLVLSGSCSPVTAGQIDWALENGFTGVALDPHAPDAPRAAGQVLSAIAARRSVVVFSSRGATDGAAANSRRLGDALGRVAEAVMDRGGVSRLLLAGGDTSSYAARSLQISAIEMIAPLAPGAPLCRVRSPRAQADGLEICFKGGQVGAPDFFGAVRRGTL